MHRTRNGAPFEQKITREGDFEGALSLFSYSTTTHPSSIKNDVMQCPRPSVFDVFAPF